MARKHKRDRALSRGSAASTRREEAADPLQSKFLSEVLRRNPRVLKVLHQHGVHFCAGCFLTLTSPLEKVAAYHAVPDREAFLKDLRKALGRRG